jgi:DNA-binding PadR family transcriptional regulator
MARRAEFSAQTLSVLAALCAEPREWRHGYGIAKDTGLKSGSLYPILIRLADRGLVEACWEEGQPAGRPRRHLYRLTPDGLASARAALTATPARARASGRGGRRVAAGEVRWAD